MDVAVRRDDQLDAFRLDVMQGLARPQKSLPSRWLYDPRGCDLFEQYHDAAGVLSDAHRDRHLREHAADVAEFWRHRCQSARIRGRCRHQTEILVGSLERPRSYIPIDIAAGFLDLTAARFRQHFTNLAVNPVVADFTSDSRALTAAGRGASRAFFPGFDHRQSECQGCRIAAPEDAPTGGAPGAAIIGVDLKKDLDVLLPAYDDSAGVTADISIATSWCASTASWMGNSRLHSFVTLHAGNEVESAVEMHLESAI